MRQARSRFLASLSLLIVGIAVAIYPMIYPIATDPASPDAVDIWRGKSLFAAAVACVLLPWCIKCFMEYRTQIRNKDKEMDSQ